MKRAIVIYSLIMFVVVYFINAIGSAIAFFKDFHNNNNSFVYHLLCLVGIVCCVNSPHLKDKK